MQWGLPRSSVWASAVVFRGFAVEGRYWRNPLGERRLLFVQKMGTAFAWEARQPLLTHCLLLPERTRTLFVKEDNSVFPLLVKVPTLLVMFRSKPSAIDCV